MIMKTIKYFAAFVCAALVMGACTETDGLSDQNAGKEKPVVEITQKVATDLDLQFNLKVTDNANQFGYVLLAGHGNTVPTPVSILANEVSGALAAETFWYEENDEDTYVKSVTIDCSEFKTPYEKYQVFAVAITADGLAGDVVSLDVTMNDKTAPAPVSFNPDANTVEVEWNEEVVLGTGKAYVSVIAWGVGRFALQDQEIAAENISVEGNVLTIVCPQGGNGAGYIVSLAEGVVKDLSGNASPAIESGLNSNLEYVNIGWDTPNVEIPISAASFVTPAEDVNWAAEDANLVFTLPTEVMANTQVKNPISVIYNEAEGVSQLFAEWTLAEDSKTVTVYLPKMPTGEFDVTVKAGAFYDAWGNVTSAFEPATLRYSNYLVSVQPGSYLVDYLTADAEGNPVLGQFPIQIVKIDETSFMLAADWFNYAYSKVGQPGYTCKPYLYGTLDAAKSQIVFDGTQIDPNTGALGKNAFASAFFQYDEAGQYILAFWGGGNGDAPITMSYDEDGYLVSMSYCDYSIHTAQGAYVTTWACTNASDDADARVVYVPETTANAPSFSAVKSLDPIAFERICTK